AKPKGSVPTVCYTLSIDIKPTDRLEALSVANKNTAVILKVTHSVIQ
ncbi:MAG: hypothetical protein ACI9RZ_002449, partial [Sphingobacteriales bacterium]